MGQIQKWKFGELLCVKDVPSNSGGLNNVLSAEPMPMHFDGLFKIVDGVPKPPSFQIFTTPTGSPIGSGRTLFAASRLIFQHLPAPCTLESLRHLTWGVKTPAFEAAHLTKMPLISQHPSTGKAILRYHEHWPQERTAFDPSHVSIEGTTEDNQISIRQAIEQSLYDRRVCTRIEWEKGDVLISDNLSMMHTREGFNSQQIRELWRIHVD